jgi:ACR3 family arsenite efflux pump ArsB
MTMTGRRIEEKLGLETLLFLFFIAVSIAVGLVLGFGIINIPSLFLIVGIILFVFYFVSSHSDYITSTKKDNNYQDSTRMGFSVSARNFEVSIAIALAAFALYLYVGKTTTIVPLLEIPLMLLLVWMPLRRRQEINALDAFKQVGNRTEGQPASEQVET